MSAGAATARQTVTIPATLRRAVGARRGLRGSPMENSLRALALVFVASIVVLGAALGSTSAIAPLGSDGAGVPMLVGP